tara:strand:- start:316 stop:765 length:450 start_codon:yes stop_codon:yes gene_type:complete
MSEWQENNIKLIGKNEEDLKIISAYIQDSVVTVKDMVFLKKNRMFLLIVNRFMWENIVDSSNKENQRVKCAIKFEGIFEVKSKKINQQNKEKRLEFLTIECNRILDKNYEIKFFFAGGSIITLISEFIEVSMHDLGKPWAVKHVPKHKI